jgi:hypothetical protein
VKQGEDKVMVSTNDTVSEGPSTLLYSDLICLPLNPSELSSRKGKRSRIFTRRFLPGPRLLHSRGTVVGVGVGVKWQGE